MNVSADEVLKSKATHNLGVLYEKQGELQKVQERKLPRRAAPALRTGRRRKSYSEAIETGSD